MPYMGFWKKAEIELDYYGLSRKELSAKSGVPMTTINRAMERDSQPFALDALRVAKALHVSLEYLLDLPETKAGAKKNESDESHQIEMYKKYHAVIETLEKLPQSKQKGVVEIVKFLALLCE